MLLPFGSVIEQRATESEHTTVRSHLQTFRKCYRHGKEKRHKNDNSYFLGSGRPRETSGKVGGIDASCARGVGGSKCPPPPTNTFLKNKNTTRCHLLYFILLVIDSACFGHYYALHQELATIMFSTTMVVSFLGCCRLDVRCRQAGVVSGLQVIARLCAIPCSPDTTPV